MNATYSFGEWSKQRRIDLRFTQRAIAEQIFCSTAMVKKIEADERQPSPELAELLAQALQVPTAYRPIFLACTRGERPVDTLPVNFARDAAAAGDIATSSARAALPSPATALVGRTAELADIAGLLANDDCRLVTLAGTGGVGKTRLAIEAARAAQAAFVAGAAFVSLAAVTDPAGLAQAVAQALTMPLLGTDPPQAQLQRILRSRNLLLVLDNFEQLADGAPVLAEWLAAAPDLKLLITSRERLNLAEEWLYPVAGFGVEAAVSLFTQTARRARPGFDRIGEGAAMAAICRLVGGHALAVELAASWTRLMPCTDIVARIQQDFDFLAGGPRNVPDRHRSLRALFDHSWGLLSLDEQRTLARLSVFRGGFAPEQAAAVAGAPWHVLFGLVDKSLVEVTGAQRYDLHDLVRQYAAQKLVEMGEVEEARRNHFESSRALGQQLMRQTIGPQAGAGFDRFDREQDNLWAALAWGVETQQSEAVLALIDSVFPFLLRGGHWQAGEKWLLAALAQSGDAETVPVAVGRSHLATFSALQGRYQDAFPNHQLALSMARRLGDPYALVCNLIVQGQAAAEKDQAYAAFEEAIAICRAHQRDWLFGRYWAELLAIYGDRLLDYGYVIDAETKYRESLDRYRLVGDVNMIAYPLGNLGRLALRAGRLQEAHDLISESMRYIGGGSRVALGDWLFRLGQVHLYLGKFDAAATDLSTTLALYAEINNLPGQASVLACLAEVALAKDDLTTAGNQIQESIHLFHAVYASIRMNFSSGRQTQSSDATESILRAGLVAAAQGKHMWAVTLLSCAEAIVAESGYQPIPPLAAKVTASFALLQERLSPTELLAAAERGRAMSLEELFDSF
jgi:predicted ATPase/DNA-binding XRE family transcriptional regulator